MYIRWTAGKNFFWSGRQYATQQKSIFPSAFGFYDLAILCSKIHLAYQIPQGCWPDAIHRAREFRICFGTF